MDRVSTGDALGEGFGLIRRQPLVVLIWGALQVAWSVLTLVAMSPARAGIAASLAKMTALQTSGRPADALAALGPLLGFEGEALLAGLVSTCVTMILYCAAFRSILKPEEGRLAYLRLGMAELFLVLFTLGFVIALWLGAVIAMIPIFLVIGAASVAHAAVVGVLVGIIGFIGVIALAIWITIRLALVGPMTVEDGRFHLADAWRLSKGHAGALFLIGLCLFVIIVVVGIVQLVLTFALGGAEAQSLMATLQGNRTGLTAQAFPAITPGLVVRYLISIPISGCLLAVLCAPWARVYRDLAQPDVADTFA